MNKLKKFISIVVGSSVLISILALTGCSTQDTSNLPSEASQEEVVAEIIPDKPKQIIVDEINNLLKGDTDTVVKYFGESDVYTAEAVRDRVSVAKITFVSILDGTKDTQENNSIDDIEGILNGDMMATIHICTMDYLKTKEAVDSLTDRLKVENPSMAQEEMNEKVTKEVAARAQNGEFEVHVTLPIKLEYKNGKANIIIDEAFKAVITGGWYNPTGATLISGDCPIREAAQAEVESQGKDNIQSNRETNTEKNTEITNKN